MSVTVQLYTKPGCHLCEDALADLARLRRRHPHAVEQVDITVEAELLARYGERIPVLVIAGREYAAPLDVAEIQRALEAAEGAEIEGGPANVERTEIEGGPANVERTDIERGLPADERTESQPGLAAAKLTERSHRPLLPESR